MTPGSQTIVSFAAEALAHPGRKRDYLLGRITANAPGHVVGFIRVLNLQEIRKNMKRHGDPDKRVDGQPPITLRDFTLIPHIVAEGIFRTIGEPRANKPQRVEYRHEIAGQTFVYTELIGVERRRAQLWSFYRAS